MIRALYTATDGLIIQERRQAVISNNLTNASTSGYKKQDLFSKEMNKAELYYMDQVGDSKYVRRDIGSMAFGSEVDEIFFNFEQGMIQETDKPTDLALEGDGFFKVQWNNGVGYTRNGNFRIDNEGYMTMQDGVTRLLATNNTTGAQEPIQIGTKELKVDRFGQVFLDDVNTHTIQTVSFAPDVNMQALGNSIFTVPAGTAEVQTDAYMHQSKLERSNVNVIDEMVKLIETSRSFESGQKVIQALDNILGKTVSEVGRVR